MIEDAQAAKEDLAIKTKAAEARGEGLFLRGDSPEARAVVTELDRLRNEVGVQDQIIGTANRRLREIDLQDVLGAIQREEYQARQAFFRALRTELVAQIPESVVKLIDDAQMASAQGGDGLNYGPFCDRYIRSDASRATDSSIDSKVSYANRLLAEYGE
ncbi:MAG TPA: hypothetical protein VK130_07595 [Steroidobacteraceae bacterium]|nr:hypothetical protein [Steroidobacteraceae bacterium]